MGHVFSSGLECKPFPGLQVEHPFPEMNAPRNISDLQIHNEDRKKKKDPANILEMGPKSKHETHLETHA